MLNNKGVAVHEDFTLAPPTVYTTLNVALQSTAYCWLNKMAVDKHNEAAIDIWTKTQAHMLSSQQAHSLSACEMQM